jgi:hypothetical protein
MKLSDYFELKQKRLTFTRESASAFAKQIAGDFNPLHDPDNKWFCVPGDLLFSVLLHQYGLHENVSVVFAGMVDGTADVLLQAELAGSSDGEPIAIKDARDRDVLITQFSGEKTLDAAFIENLTEQYVQFSGKTFPDVLQPLMQQHGVMINPTRPLVIYQSMRLTMTELSGEAVAVAFTGATLKVEGKKGMVELGFELSAGGQLIGTGAKSMVLGGLREYDDEAMQKVVDDYNALKTAG